MIRRRTALSNNGAGHHKVLGLLLPLIFLLAGCLDVPICETKQYWNCTVPVNEAWSCQALTTDTSFECQYTHTRSE